MRWPSLIVVVALSCRSIPAYTPGAIAGRGSRIPEVAAARTRTVEDAPPASPRLTEQVPLGAEIDSWFAGRQNQRLYLQLDRPLYKPGWCRLCFG